MKLAFLAAAATATALATASTAQAAVLTFDGDICAGGTSCQNSEAIDQTYGDIAGQLDVAYSSGGNQPMQFWSDQYSDLTNVAYGSGAGASVLLTPLSGYKVTLNGFDLGAWPLTNRTSQVTIREIGGGVLFSSGAITISGQTRSQFSGSYTSASGIEINFGPDNFNVGIDNIDFTVNAVGGGAIPEPGTWALMIAGFGLAGGALRRRKAAIA